MMSTMKKRGVGGTPGRSVMADPPSNSGPDRSFYEYPRSKYNVKGHTNVNGSSMSFCSKCIVVMSMALGLLLLLNQDAANGILSWGNDNVKPAATAAVNTAANKLSSVRKPNTATPPASAPSLRGAEQQQAELPKPELAVQPVQPKTEAPKPVPVPPPPKPAPVPVPAQQQKQEPVPAPKPAPVPAPEPHYEVWSKLTTQEEKSKAMDRVLGYVRNLKNYIPTKTNVWRRSSSDKGIVGPCNLVPMGRGIATREVCDVQSIVPEGEKCHFVSFGTSPEHSFATDMALKEQCIGYAIDPDWDHQSSMDKMVKYEQKHPNRLTPCPSKTGCVSAPQVKNHILKSARVQLLDMDCDGCEYALARDVIQEAPHFFDSIDQMSITFHLSQKKGWLDSDEAAYYFGLMLEMLEKSHLEIQKIETFPCENDGETGLCHDKLKYLEFPCGNQNSCHRYLFSRKKLSKDEAPKH